MSRKFFTLGIVGVLLLGVGYLFATVGFTWESMPWALLYSFYLGSLFPMLLFLGLSLSPLVFLGFWREYKSLPSLAALVMTVVCFSLILSYYIAIVVLIGVFEIGEMASPLSTVFLLTQQGVLIVYGLLWGATMLLWGIWILRRNKAMDLRPLVLFSSVLLLATGGAHLLLEVLYLYFLPLQPLMAIPHPSFVLFGAPPIFAFWEPSRLLYLAKLVLGSVSFLVLAAVLGFVARDDLKRSK